MFIYTYSVKRDEDCLQCFNRHQHLLFSRYQYRRNNNIEKETFLNSAKDVYQKDNKGPNNSFSGYGSSDRQD